MAETDGYGLGIVPEGERIPAPDLPYRPPTVTCDIPVSIIGCGGISGHHLASYRAAGYRVTALCDRDPGKARSRRDEYYPGARLCDDYRALLDSPEVAVVDI